MTLTEALAELAIQTPGTALPANAVTAARRMTIDTVATTLAGWRQPGIAPVVRQMRTWGGAPESTILTFGDRVPAPNAAFSNGAMSHALDYDDVYYESSLHIMASVLPVALAVAEQVNATGRQLIEAVAMGVEVAGRIGLVMQEANTGYGYLPSSIVGGWGATAAAARLMRLSAEQTVHALGINYAQASGNRQALLDATLTKRMQPAYAGRSALWASALAAEGVTGATRSLEGEAGFFKLYVQCEPPSLAKLMAPFDYWQIEHVSIKPYPSCGGNHRSTQAAITLAQEEDLDPGEIERVEVWVPYIDIWFVGKPFALGNDPQVSAQFSAAYCAALALTHRKAGLEQYRAENVISDQAVRSLAERVQVCEIPGSKGLRTHEATHGVKVWTKDGRLLHREAKLLHGQWQDPFSNEEVIAKLGECAGFAGLWTTEQTAALGDVLLHLETAPSVRKLVQRHLVTPQARVA